jgi:phage terminase large subunit
LSGATLSPDLPEILEPLFRPSRYKILYGGRGGGKSWGIARALLIMGTERKMRILCAREFQSSIADSVHKLLSDQIAEMGMSAFYSVEKATIYGINGTEFRFAGIRTNINAIKSFEGIDICWCEEAANVSKHSWMTLIPTIRKDGSEIWVSFNPELEEDETYKRFVISPPANAIVVKVGWADNPWFPDTLRQEADDLRAKSIDDYLHIYGGNCKHALEGAVFAKELRDAEANDPPRITRVPYIQAKPVDTFWDLGKRDMTSIWFAQVVGFEFRVIDFYENCGQQLAHYIKTLKELPYAYGTHWLPHDGDHDTLQSERTIKQQMQAAFSASSIQVIPKTSKTTQIDAGRAVFSQCWFDKEKTADGIQHLRHYQFEVNPDTGQRGREPLHDEHSHAADAFMSLGLALHEPTAKLKLKVPTAPLTLRAPSPSAWLNR